MSMLISVITVVSPNRKEDIFRCLESINQSTFKNFEIIAINNSCDSNIDEQIRKNFEKVKVYSMAFNSGIAAYNFAFKKAIGKYLFVLDEDCKIKKGDLRKIYYNFESKPKRVAVVSLNVYNPFDNSYAYKHLFQLKTPQIATFAGGASVFRKSIFDKIGYYDQNFFCWFHEDDLALRIIEAGYDIHFEKKIVINHYDKTNKIRTKKMFLTFRNKAWLNIKYFSAVFFPFLAIRDILLIIQYSRKNLIKGFLYGLIGYLYGYLSFLNSTKRLVLTRSTQHKYLKHYLFGRIVGKLIKE